MSLPYPITSTISGDILRYVGINRVTTNGLIINNNNTTYKPNKGFFQTTIIKLNATIIIKVSIPRYVTNKPIIVLSTNKSK
ncbi:hypothetical protein J1TS1_39170 [Shouchella clausii]|nr:hypothetical protein J1TS1_39170 [Shouchella clausii]